MSFRRINKVFILSIFLSLLTACQNEENDKLTNIDTVENNNEGQITDIENRVEDETFEAEEVNENEETTNNVGNLEKGSLLKAVEENDEELVRSILEDTNYEIDETNDMGETPLLIAVHNNFIEISKMLIDHNADINKQDHISDSPYLYAGAQGKTEIVKHMLENATPDEMVFNRFGGNSLIPAAEKGHLENVKLLLESSESNIDHQNDFGYTALIEAVALADGSKVYQDIIKVLLENGANPHLRDNNGNTALDYAHQLNYVEMQKILQEYN